jgi:hypothetical protein
MKTVEAFLAFVIAAAIIVGAYTVSYALVMSGHWLAGAFIALLVLAGIKVRY